jgi:hypothetical protein
MRLARLSPGEIVCSWNALSCQDVVIQLGFVQTTDIALRNQHPMEHHRLC